MKTNKSQAPVSHSRYSIGSDFDRKDNNNRHYLRDNEDTAQCDVMDPPSWITFSANVTHVHRAVKCFSVCSVQCSSWSHRGAVCGRASSGAGVSFIFGVKYSSAQRITAVLGQAQWQSRTRTAPKIIQRQNTDYNLGLNVTNTSLCHQMFAGACMLYAWKGESFNDG